MFGSGLSLAGLAKKFSSRNVIACDKLQDPEAAENLLADPSWPLRLADGESPTAFDPGMIQPLATLENTARWRREQSG